MLKGYKYRIYPTDEQKAMINKNIGCCRYVYNRALDIINKHYEETKEHLSAQYNVYNMFSQWKNEEGMEWLKESDARSVSYTLIHLDRAFSSFFKKNGKHPKFKRKGYSGSYVTDKCKFDFDKRTIRIPKIGEVKAVFHRKFNGTPKNITVTKQSFDYYEVSVCVDDGLPKEELKTPTLEGAVGVDLGIKQEGDGNAITNDGTKFPVSDVRRLNKRLARLQKRLSKKKWEKNEDGKKVPSRNYLKLKDKCAKLNAKIARVRSYNSHMITSTVTNMEGVNTIAVEDLNVNRLLRNNRFARTVANANMGEILRQFEYKCDEKGINFVKVDRFFASTKICSKCGYVYKGIALNEREWTCPQCGTHHDRDVNAAINIRNKGFETIKAEGKRQTNPTRV